jgi:hypothetical protein
MICQECQAEMPKSARFCNECRAPAPSQFTIQSKQDITTLKGTAIGVVDNRKERREGSSISTHSEIGTIEEGGTAIGAILGGESGNVHVGGQQNYHQREINTGGGTYVEGGVHTGGGEFVGRDKNVHGDEVRRNKISGDKTIMGNVSNSTVAAGSGAQGSSSQGVSGKELIALFDSVYRRIESRPEKPEVDKEELKESVSRIQTEAGKGEEANPAKLQRWLRTLADVAPDILEVTVSSLINPAAGVASAIRRVAEKVWQERGS